MSTGVVLLAGAVAAKALSLGWLASIATSPVAVASRRRFLQANKEGLDNLVKLGAGPTPCRLQEITRDFEILEAHLEPGWDTPYLFAAASRVSTWKFAEHVYGATSGIYRLTANTASAAAESVGNMATDAMNGINSWVDALFPQTPTDKNK